MANTRVSDIQKMTEDGVDLVFNRAAKMPRRKYYAEIVTEKSLPKKIGNYHTIGNIGAAEEKIEGNEVVFDKIQENYQTTITSSTIHKGVEATMEALEYDLNNVVEQTFGTALMRVMQTKKEKAVAAVYNGMFTDTGADGVAVLSASHPLQRSVLLNDNLATGALTPDNFIAAKNKFNSIYDQTGDFYDSEATHLVIHPNKMFLALQILESSLMALQLSNTKNTTNEVMPVKIIGNRYLTDGYWFLLDKTMDDAGVILQNKKGVVLKTWWHNETLAYRGLAYEMYGCGTVSPGYGIVGSAG
jgi:hypothetical protein